MKSSHIITVLIAFLAGVAGAASFLDQPVDSFPETGEIIIQDEVIDNEN